MAWREVSMDEFYRHIGPQNVHPTPTGPWPYTSMFKTPSGDVRGKTEGYLPDGSRLPKNRYFLPK